MSNTYTEKELQMLKAFYEESTNCCGACDEDENMSYMNAKDLQEVLGGSMQSIGGIMSSLSDKDCIFDTLDSARGSRLTDWNIGQLGVEALGHKWESE